MIKYYLGHIIRILTLGLTLGLFKHVEVTLHQFWIGKRSIISYKWEKGIQINPCYINRHACTNAHKTYDNLHKRCLYDRLPEILQNCMYITKVDDQRLCSTPECNVMSVDQRSAWRKKVRAINSRAKKMNCPCYKYWDFIEIKPRTRKISQNTSNERLEPVEEVIILKIKIDWLIKDHLVF